MRHETKWTSSIILLREEKFLRHGYLEETVELDPRGVEQEIERFDRESEAPEMVGRGQLFDLSSSFEEKSRPNVTVSSLEIGFL